MPRPRLLLAVAAAAALLAAGCSGDDESDEKASTAQETAPVERPKARSETEAPKKGANDKKPEAGKRKRKSDKTAATKAEVQKERRAARREEAQDRKADREFDQEFNETPFERTVLELPIRKPPLFVEQYITEKGSTTVYTAVSLKRFLCGRSAAQRKAAVTAFYREADRLFRRRGIRNFVQVVTPVAATTEELPALATGRKGSVQLTARGRAKGPC